MSSFNYMRSLSVQSAQASRVINRQALRGLSSYGKVSTFSILSPSSSSIEPPSTASSSTFLNHLTHTSPSMSNPLLTSGSGVLGATFVPSRSNYFKSKKPTKSKKGGNGSRRNQRNNNKSNSNSSGSDLARSSETENDTITSKHLIPIIPPNYPNTRKYHHAEYSFKQAEKELPTRNLHNTMKSLKNPKMISANLDEYVVGQETAKKILSVAVFNHYKRLEANLSSESHPQPVVGDGFKVVGNIMKPSKEEKARLDKSNVLLIGPTGSGKTLLAKTLAQMLHVPFSMNDATPFTQAGYVGEDVEVVIQRLLQNSEHNVKLAEQGIVFIDEIDKIARKSDALSQTRDVSGEGVQQSLLRILEGTTVNITEKNTTPRPGNVFNGNKTETFHVNTDDILFILSGAFVGLDKIISDRLAKASIGFNATVKSSAKGLHPTISTTSKNSSLTNPLFHVDPTDLIKFGFIPEFIGRVPVIAPVSNLDEASLVRILTEPKNSLTKQYESLFNMNQTKLVFTEGALLNISKIAIKKQSGARGLRRIMENVLLDPMYDAPGSQFKYIVITRDVVNATYQPLYFKAEELDETLKAISDDDGTISPRIKAILKKHTEQKYKTIYL